MNDYWETWNNKVRELTEQLVELKKHPKQHIKAIKQKEIELYHLLAESIPL